VPSPATCAKRRVLRLSFTCRRYPHPLEQVDDARCPWDAERSDVREIALPRWRLFRDVAASVNRRIGETPMNRAGKTGESAVSRDCVASPGAKVISPA
jgi:hypothetical protein